MGTSYQFYSRCAIIFFHLLRYISFNFTCDYPYHQGEPLKNLSAVSRLSWAWPRRSSSLPLSHWGQPELATPGHRVGEGHPYPSVPSPGDPSFPQEVPRVPSFPQEVPSPPLPPAISPVIILPHLLTPHLPISYPITTISFPLSSPPPCRQPWWGRVSTWGG